ncbi:hypothetical protein A0H76_2407 [Hepatospora eriocheir]|uniref:Uncharacterized protein n=1 Tax=Hepatospora eriocheir TaxID=1081669 RepID=A0A1X0QFB8_9MICR|nr:hypothetical protein A0H76_2407 [Hepatospora eriocheir]
MNNQKQKSERSVLTSIILFTTAGLMLFVFIWIFKMKKEIIDFDINNEISYSIDLNSNACDINTIRKDDKRKENLLRLVNSITYKNYKNVIIKVLEEYRNVGIIPENDIKYLPQMSEELKESLSRKFNYLKEYDNKHLNEWKERIKRFYDFSYKNDKSGLIDFISTNIIKNETQNAFVENSIKVDNLLITSSSYSNPKSYLV